MSSSIVDFYENKVSTFRNAFFPWAKTRHESRVCSTIAEYVWAVHANILKYIYIYKFHIKVVSRYVKQIFKIVFIYEFIYPTGWLFYSIDSWEMFFMQKMMQKHCVYSAFLQTPLQHWGFELCFDQFCEIQAYPSLERILKN